MAKYIIDENLPDDLDIWTSENFLHIINIPNCITDSHIWKYAIDYSLIILTKDTDFYHRYLSTVNTPKVVWFRIGNMKKSALESFIANIWNDIEQLLIAENFLIVNKGYIESI